MLSRIREVTETALENGSLKPFQTEETFIAATSTTPAFSIRLAAKSDKPVPSEKGLTPDSAKRSNPFLPYDERLFVQHVSPSHVLLLNKFPVVAHHALVVTRDFQPQSDLLTLADHAALWSCLTEFRSIAFYNCGRLAGASQPHKHLQIIPLPLCPQVTDMPFDALLKGCELHGAVVSLPTLPFVHAATSMKHIARVAAGDGIDHAATLSMQAYTALLADLQVRVTQPTPSDRLGEACDARPFAYNLVVTPDVMLAVPRSAETFHGISVNSLGFCGCLLVRSHDQLQQLLSLTVGPMAALQSVTFSEKIREGESFSLVDNDVRNAHR